MKIYLHTLLTLITLTLAAACGGSGKSGPPSPPEAPERGWTCVSALNQSDEPMDTCYYDFRVSSEVIRQDQAYEEACMDYLDEVGDDAEGCEEFLGGSNYPPVTACAEGEQAVYGAPGEKSVYAECGSLSGHLQFYLAEGENAPYSSRLVGSLCYDEQPLVASPTSGPIYLDLLVGFSQAHRCGNWIFDNADVEQQIEVIQLSPEGYLEVAGEKWEYSDTHPKHLTLLTEEDALEAGEEVDLLVRIRERVYYDQEIEIPVTVRGD